MKLSNVTLKEKNKIITHKNLYFSAHAFITLESYGIVLVGRKKWGKNCQTKKRRI
jgi:hypothetical protein